jgi:hypothetical protein
MLKEVLRQAADMTAFEFFCVLDGVSVIENTPDKGNIELFFEKGGERIRLNDPQGEELQNLFNGLCQEGANTASRQEDQISPYDSDKAQRLRSKMVIGDDLDLHHVPDKFASLHCVNGYDPQTAPAIALPKSEHRRVSVPK